MTSSQCFEVAFGLGRDAVLSTRFGGMPLQRSVSVDWIPQPRHQQEHLQQT